jgi:hypothetical protein
MTPVARSARTRSDVVEDVGVGVVVFPAFGQQTNDYEAVRRLVAGTSTTDLEFLGLALYGSRRAVARLTGALRLL